MTIPNLHPAQLWQRDQTNCLRGIAVCTWLFYQVNRLIQRIPLFI